MRKAILLNSTSSYNHIGCYLTTFGLKRLLNESGIMVAYECEVNNYDFSFVKKILDSDDNLLLVINGEGTFHDDQSYAIALIEFTKNYQDRCLLMNSQLRHMSKQHVDIISGYKLVQVRTDYDFQWCIDHGIDDVQYCPDMLFYSGYSSLMSSASSNNSVIYTDSHLMSSSISIYENYTSSPLNTKKWVNLHYSVAGAKKSKVKLSILHLLSKLIPKRFGYKYLNYRNLECLSFVIRDFHNSSCVFTGRYHGACLAIMLGKPLIYGSSNTSKIKDLCNDFGYGVDITEAKDDVPLVTKELINQVQSRIDNATTSLKEKLGELNL